MNGLLFVSRRLCYVILCVPVLRSFIKEKNKAVVVVVKAASCCHSRH